MNDEAGGRRRWYVPDAYLPGDSSHGVESHESACVLNTGSQPAVVSLTFYLRGSRSRRPGGSDGRLAAHTPRSADGPRPVVRRRAAARRPVRLHRRDATPDRPPALAARHVCRRLHPRHDDRVWRVARSSSRRSSRSSSGRAASGRIPASPTSAAATPRPRSSSTDPITGEPRTVLAVKGSGGDLGTLDRRGARAGRPRAAARDGARLRGPRPGGRHGRACSTTPASGRAERCPRSTRLCTDFSRLAHVDHLHPDALIAFAAAADGPERRCGRLRRPARLARLAAAGLRSRPAPARPRRRAARPRRRRPRRPRRHLVGRHLRRSPRRSRSP